MVRIVIADDHALLRSGVRKILESQPDLEVVGEAGSGKEAVDRVRELSPDVLLLDLSMPDGDGFDVLDELRKLRNRTRVVVVTGHNDEHHRRFALEAGAFEVLKKAEAPTRLVATIREIAGGVRRRPELDKPTIPVSQRELQVLVPLASGKNHHEIAAELDITVKTVDTHRRKILTKLGLRNNAELTRYAVRCGLIEA